MHHVTLPLAFCAMPGVTVLALLPTPATVLPEVPPPPELPQPAAIAAHARIAPALASFLFTMFPPPGRDALDGRPLFLTRVLSNPLPGGTRSESPPLVKTGLTAPRVPCGSMARCFVTRKLPGTALERLAAVHELDLWAEPSPPGPEKLIEHAREADGLLSQLTERVDASLLDACPRLAAVANYAVGVDNVDLAAASERGVPVGNTPGVLTEATADLAWALMLSAARRLPEAERAMRGG